MNQGGNSVWLSNPAAVSQLTRILAWHEAVHAASVAQFGERPLSERVGLAKDLINEETRELMAELDDIEHTVGEPDPMAVANAAKEAADVFFVVIQAMHALSVNFEAVLEEVIRSNWSKLEGGVAQFRADGKLEKGPSYSPADVASVLARQ